MTTLNEDLCDELKDYDVARKHGDKQVVCRVDGTEDAFPDIHYKYRNVFHWWILEDGSVVGWNESPRTGWALVRIGKKGVEKFYQRAKGVRSLEELCGGNQ